MSKRLRGLEQYRDHEENLRAAIEKVQQSNEQVLADAQNVIDEFTHVLEGLVAEREHEEALEQLRADTRLVCNRVAHFCHLVTALSIVLSYSLAGVRSCR